MENTSKPTLKELKEIKQKESMELLELFEEIYLREQKYNYIVCRKRQDNYNNNNKVIIFNHNFCIKNEEALKECFNESKNKINNLFQTEFFHPNTLKLIKSMYSLGIEPNIRIDNNEHLKVIIQFVSEFIEKFGTKERNCFIKLIVGLQ